MGHAYLSYVPAFPKPSQVKRENVLNITWSAT